MNVAIKHICCELEVFSSDSQYNKWYYTNKCICLAGNIFETYNIISNRLLSLSRGVFIGRSVVVVDGGGEGGRSLLRVIDSINCQLNGYICRSFEQTRERKNTLQMISFCWIFYWHVVCYAHIDISFFKIIWRFWSVRFRISR